MLLCSAACIRCHRFAQLTASLLCAANTSGNPIRDRQASIDLLEAAFAFAARNLRFADSSAGKRSSPSTLVLKYFESPEAQEFRKDGEWVRALRALSRALTDCPSSPRSAQTCFPQGHCYESRCFTERKLRDVPRRLRLETGLGLCKAAR